MALKGIEKFHLYELKLFVHLAPQNLQKNAIITKMPKLSGLILFLSSFLISMKLKQLHSLQKSKK